MLSDDDLPKLPGLTKLHTVLPDDYRYGHIYGFTIGQMREYARAVERAAYERAAALVIELTEDSTTADAIRALGRQHD